MAHVLHIDVSPRGERSHTRRLAHEFVEIWRRAHPEDSVSHRDLAADPPAPVTQAWIAAAFAPAPMRTASMRADLLLSDRLVDELLAADILVIGTPMYNFTVPASLKAYIDQIVRVGRTFAFEPWDTAAPYKPLTASKRAFVIVASGDSGYEQGGSLASWNHIEPYLRSVLAFIGIRDVQFIYAGNDEFGGKRLADSLAEARHAVRQIAISTKDAHSTA